MQRLAELVARARAKRWLAVCVVNLRILIGFAFIPAGLKKILGQPFTDADNTGPFHDFLHAFQATGGFYRAVGVLQVLAALLLITQRFAFAGALLVLPVLTAIVTFCWSTQVYPTATVATLMWLGTLALVAWDLHRWLPVITGRPVAPVIDAPLDHRLWQRCGAAVLVIYLGYCLVAGEVYRPRGARPDEPGFYLFPVIALMPIVTLVIERRRLRR
jgi:uncharacterized membrane protein YphA (DoxX/SURF4 family)